MILDVVQRYAEYLAARTTASAEGRILDGNDIISEFQRYYSTEPFARAADVAKQVESQAPGSTAKGAAPFASAPPLAKLDVDLPDLEAARVRLQAMKTIESRVDYYCGEGRPLLDAFAAIVGNTRMINAAAKHHTSECNTGYRTELRDGGLRHHARNVTAALHGRTASGWKDGARALFRTYAANTARELSLEQLRVIADHPDAKREVKAELRRREKILGKNPVAGAHESAAGATEASAPSVESCEIHRHRNKNRRRHDPGAATIRARPRHGRTRRFAARHPRTRRKTADKTQLAFSSNVWNAGTAQEPGKNGVGECNPPCRAT